MNELTLKDLIAERDKLNDMIKQYQEESCPAMEEYDNGLPDIEGSCYYAPTNISITMPSITVSNRTSYDFSTHDNHSVRKSSSVETKLAGGDSAVKLLSGLVTGFMNL